MGVSVFVWFQQRVGFTYQYTHRHTHTDGTLNCECRGMNISTTVVWRYFWHLFTRYFLPPPPKYVLYVCVLVVHILHCVVVFFSLFPLSHFSYVSPIYLSKFNTQFFNQYFIEPYKVYERAYIIVYGLLLFLCHLVQVLKWIHIVGFFVFSSTNPWIL